MTDLADLDAVLDRFDTTGCVVTTAHGGVRDGCFVSFVAPASIEPKRLLVLTSHENLTHDLVSASGIVAVHVLGAGNTDWVHLFGRTTGREVDKLAGLRWRTGVTGAPLLEDAVAWVEGRVLTSLDCGDHTARLVEPLSAVLNDSTAPPLMVASLFQRGVIAPAAPERFWLREPEGG
jgi:flavin reductase (DIM6/NTAB) family NADH-FMN oxidoreductase RutF